MIMYVSPILNTEPQKQAHPPTIACNNKILSLPPPPHIAHFEFLSLHKPLHSACAHNLHVLCVYGGLPQHLPPHDHGHDHPTKHCHTNIMHSVCSHTVITYTVVTHTGRKANIG